MTFISGAPQCFDHVLSNEKKILKPSFPMFSHLKHREEQNKYIQVNLLTKTYGVTYLCM